MKKITCCLMVLLMFSCDKRPVIKNVASYNVLFARKINGDEMRLHAKIYSKLDQTELIKITTTRRRLFPADTLHSAKYIFWVAGKLPSANLYDPDEEYSHATILYPHDPLERSFVSDKDLDGASCHVSIKTY